MSTDTIDLRPKVHLTDAPLNELDNMVRDLAASFARFQICVATSGLESNYTQTAWRHLNDAAGELWTEGLRDE